MTDEGNSLLIFNDKTALERLPFLKSLAPRCILFPLTVDETIVDSLKSGLESAGIGIEATLPVTQMLDQTATDIRGQYIEFIEGFTDKPISGTSSIKEYFSHPFEDFSLWWLSVVFEKSNYKSESLHRLVKLVTILETCRNLNIRSVVYAFTDQLLYEDIKRNQNQFNLLIHPLYTFKRFGVVKELFRRVIHAAFFMASNLKRWLLLGSYRKKVTRLRKREGSAPFIIVTYFPLVDKDALSAEKFVNRYYEPIQKAFGEKEKDCVSWLAMPVAIDGFTWKDSLELSERFVKNGYGFFLIDEWLSFRRICKAVLIYLYIFLKFLCVAPRIKNECRFGEEKIEVWSTLRSAWLTSYCGFDLMQEVLNYILFKACLRDLSDSKMLIYLCENQAWEKAMCLAARDFPIVKIGIQHTSVPIFATRLFFYSASKQPELPIPDYLVCAGHIPAQLHGRFGFSAERIVEWGAVRYQNLKSLIERDILWKERENLVVVAGSILYQETRELLEWTALALDGNSEIEVVLKAHPAQPYEPILAEFPKVCQSFKVSHKPITELLSRAKGLVVSSSTCAIEGIALKCPVIVPRLISLVDMSPLREVSDLPIYVDSVAKLREKLQGVVGGTVSPLDPERCRQLVSSYFKFLDSDQEFLTSLPMYEAVWPKEKRG